MEMNVCIRKMERVRTRIGLPNGIIIPSNGRSRGIALLWEKDLDVELKSYTRNHIDAVVTDPRSGFKWRITGFYGNPDTHQRKESWNLLQFLSN